MAFKCKEQVNEIPIKKPDPSSLQATHPGFLDGKLIACLPYMSLCFMAYSAATAAAVYDPANIVFNFVVFTLHTLVLYWCCYSPGATPVMMKVAALIQPVTLTTVLALRVTTNVDSLPLHIFVWTVASFTSACGFYFLFLIKPKA